MTAAVDADVVVVGGGPIGLVTAIEARRAGLSVVVVEPRTGPIDKACGEGLLPGALAALARLGVDPPGHVITGISYQDGRRRADHVFADGAGRGVRRTSLHAALLARSEELGVERRVARVDSLTEDASSIVAGGVSARWLLACDGLHSTVRRLAGLEAPPREGHLRVRTRGGGAGGASRRYGLRQHFRVPAWTDLVEVHWGPDVEAYVTPVADDLVGIAVLGPAPLDVAAALATLPALARHLDGAEPVGSIRGAGPLRQRSTRRTTGRVRLVGDASGYVDALTGEGLRVGFAQAAAVVAHLDDPAAYERAWSAATRHHRVLTGGLVAWATSPGRGGIVPVAHAFPRVYGAVVEALAR